MFCSNCGSKLPDGAAFCASCGTKVVNVANQQTMDTNQTNINQQSNEINQVQSPAMYQSYGSQNVNQNINQNWGYYQAPQVHQSPQAQQVPQGQYPYQGNMNIPGPYPTKNKSKTKLIVTISSIAVVLVAVIVAIILLTGGNVGGFIGSVPAHEKPIAYIANGVQKGDVNLVAKAFPKFLQSYILYQDGFEEMTEGLKDEYGSNFKVSYKVIAKNKISVDDLLDIQEGLITFDKAIKITDGYDLTLELKTSGSKKEDVEVDTISVYKIGSNWYILDIASF